MMLTNFDPLAYLDIDSSKFQKDELVSLKNKLFEKMGEYVTLKLSTYLTDEQFTSITQEKDLNKRLQLFKNYIPDLEQKIIQELANFKSEYRMAK